MSKKITDSLLTEIIDNLGPLNNKLRAIKNPIVKIELMWEFGKILNIYITRYELKLHELLYQIYDPHSTIKVSNITRDLGSYCYRIYQYFKKKDEIRFALMNLQSYSMFREAVPLLLNEKYNRVQKNEILKLLNSNLSTQTIKKKLIILKQQIRPLKNSRTQKAYQYQNEIKFIKTLLFKLKELYRVNESIPTENIINKIIGNSIYRMQLVNILLAISNDSFHDKIKIFSEKTIIDDLKILFKIASGQNIDRSRFRKWVLSSNKLLSLAEAIHSLNSKGDYIFYRNKIISPLK